MGEKKRGGERDEEMKAFILKTFLDILCLYLDLFSFDHFTPMSLAVLCISRPEEDHSID